MRFEICENSFMAWGTPAEIAEFVQSEFMKDKKLLSFEAVKKSQPAEQTEPIKMKGRFVNN